MWGRQIKKTLETVELKNEELTAILSAIRNNVAIIEFTPDGVITDANSHFLEVVGYKIEELCGQHHSYLCASEFARSDAYHQFWKELAKGYAQRGIFERRDSAGNILWLESIYFPVKGNDGHVVKIVKIATDVTRVTVEHKQKEAVLQALDRSQAMIVFKPDGTIINANNNFLSVIGYSLEQIVGQHHRIFCKDDFYTQYPHFWEELAKGQFMTGLFERLSSKGESIWLEASYNPIFDDDGRVMQVIKFASDVSERIEANHAINEAAHLSRSIARQTASQVVESRQILNKSVETSRGIHDQVQEAVNLIDHLNEQSKAIENIVTTISDVADQTNLLALNAAIEAARAGEQGRGFAVVADEVRQLASRTSDSTSKVAAVVKDNGELMDRMTQEMQRISTHAELGQDQINQTAEVIASIEEDARKVEEAVSKVVTNIT